MKTIQVQKGQILQRTGEINDFAYVVESGLLRSYLIDDKGKEHIFMFAPEDWIIADNQQVGQPAELFIDALEDSTVHVLKKELENFDISVELPKLVKRLSVLQKRVLMLMSSSAIERYEHFEATYPQILQRVPQRMIASYLGITPEALSTVKSHRMKAGK